MNYNLDNAKECLVSGQDNRKYERERESVCVSEFVGLPSFFLSFFPRVPFVSPTLCIVLYPRKHCC